MVYTLVSVMCVRNVIKTTDSSDPAKQQGDADEAVPEKLADDDERKEKWYRRAFFTVFPKLRRS